ncbi:MAG: polyprenyl synthetase family protein [Gammaproteobacteria bacterium]|nr:polyprenyl synthetase family protein [Gammaproteobacteria bacterium]
MVLSIVGEAASGPEKPVMGLEAITALAADDLRAVDAFIRKRLASDVELINELANYIVGSGGKRLRPLVVLLAARAAGYTGSVHINLAAVVEFIHTATLLHDDVVDGSERRRGRETANALWGNAPSVLVGDFLYSRSFQMMVEVERMRVMSVLADATNAVAEGEVLQLIHCNDPDTSEARYFDVIERKTARLFEAAARLGAVISDRSREEEDAFGAYGLNLGIAYQLIDDVLDYSADPAQTGKNLGDDLAEGKATLPLIYARDHANDDAAATLRRAIERGGTDSLSRVIGTIDETRALGYVRQRAASFCDAACAALAPFPASPERDALTALARFAIARAY